MRRGFTLVELSLALALIGVLSIIVVLIIANSVSSYHRGLTLNQINSVGMGVVDDMRAAVQSSPGRFVAKTECQAAYVDDESARNKCIADGAMSFVRTERYGTVRIGGVDSEVPLYGSFCSGAYSYIWNSGYFFNDEDYAVQNSLSKAGFLFRKAESGASASIDHDYEDGNFKLLKVRDENRAVCKAAAGVIENGSSYTKRYYNAVELRSNLKPGAFNLSCGNGNSAANSDLPAEICRALDSETVDTNILDMNGALALYDLTVAQPGESTGTNNMFYSVSFILGTVQGGINVASDGNYCETPEGYNASVENFDYCAINKFNFAAQATGG